MHDFLVSNTLCKNLISKIGSGEYKALARLFSSSFCCAGIFVFQIATPPPPFNEESYDRMDKYMSTKLSLNNAVLTLSHLLASFLHSKELKNTYHTITRQAIIYITP